MSHHGRGRGGQKSYDRKHTNGARHKPIVGGKGKEVLEAIDSDSAVIRAFMEYAAALDSKHDRYERINKISRDITIESKRIIFLLHTLDRESKKDAVLKEADTRLNQLIMGHFKDIAAELEGQDPYEFIRAYTAGLQEFIEAATFHYYLKEKSLCDLLTFDNLMIYNVKEMDTNSTDDYKCLEKADMERAGIDSPQTAGNVALASTRSIKTLVPPSEYILGIGDLTGELMRKCINNLGSGNIEGCYQTCAFVKEIYNGFLMIGNAGHKEIKRKVFTLKQSLQKMENACYMIHVRGSEIPKHMLADVFSGGLDNPLDEDEGFF